ncbi:Ig-like domain-containing protein [Ruminococcus sp. NK3A76]|uniref:Ig-like domain-containing protein n=1 Tax=Ruminococcus sp. NK3A76 TaxID=877411 RepID=UPI0012EB5D57|nr:Ig-like domain-containing protein [Ruminococcus sp. NK3A76]
MKSIKRTMAMCAAATLVFSTMGVMPAAAAGDSVDVKLVASKTVVEPGDEITVTVDLTNTTGGLGGFMFDITYDDKALEFVPTKDTENGTYPYIEVPSDITSASKRNKYIADKMDELYDEGRFMFGQITGPKEATSGSAHFLWMPDPDDGNYTDSGDVLEVTFKVKEGASAKTYYIDLDKVQFEQLIPASEGGGSKTVDANVTAASVKVNAAEVAVKDVTVTPSIIEFAKAGLTKAISAVVDPDNATDKTVTYKSGNTKIATVDASGVVTAVAEGVTNITVTAGKVSKTVKVTVAHTHTLTKVDGYDSTCTETGIKEHYECSDCGKLFADAEGKTELTEADIVIPKKAHDFTKKDVSAKYLKTEGTCTEKAVYYYSCSICGEKDTETFEGETSPSNHVHTEVRDAVEPGLFKEGYTGDTYCSDCGVKLKSGDKIEMILPDRVEPKDPTCTEDGNIEYYKYGEKLYDSNDPATAKEITLAAVTIPATGHDYYEPTYEWGANNKTCTAKRVCKNDSTHVETETVDAVETVITEATYEAGGESKFTATFTNPAFAEQTKTEATAAKNHTYEAVEAKDPTCEEDGNILYYVRDDGKLFKDMAGTEEITEEDTVVPAIGHDWELDEESVTFNDDHTACKATLVCKNDPSHTNDLETTDIEVVESVDATCTTDGSVTYLAKFQDGFEAKVTETVEATGHDWGEWEVTKEATEDEEGERTRTCSICGETETEVIPALGSEDEDGEGDDGDADADGDEDGDEDGDTDGDKDSKSDGGKSNGGKSNGGNNGATTPSTSNPVTGAAAAFGALATAIGALAIFKKRK